MNNKKKYLPATVLLPCLFQKGRRGNMQFITLIHKLSQILPSTQHTLNGFVQNHFGLIQLFLNLHNAIGLLRILVFLEVFGELGEWELAIRCDFSKRSDRIFGEEFVDNFGKDLMRY